MYVSLLRSKYKDLLKNDFDFAIKSEGKKFNSEIKLKTFFIEGKLFEGINMIPYRLIFVCRDHKWEKLPHILLVKGDYVYTHLRTKDLEANEIEYELTADRGFYVLKETPLTKIIESAEPAITHYDHHKEIFYTKTQFFLNAYAIIALIVFILTLILNVIRVTVPVGNYDWVNLILLHPVYVIICMLPVGFPAMWLAEYTFTSARISTLFHVLTSSEQPISITDENKHSPIPIPIRQFLITLCKIIVGKTTLYWEHLLSLGSLTSLCCVDKDGLLADLLYAPEKLLFIKTKEFDSENENHILPSSVVDTYQQHDQQAREQQELLDKDIELEEMHIQQEEKQDPNDNEKEKFLEQNDIKQQPIKSTEATSKKKKRNVTLQEDVINHFYDNQRENGDISPQESVNEGDNNTFLSPLHKRTLVPDYVTLDITFDRNADDESNVLTFEEPDWKDHVNTLKPLGLNALITGCSPLPDFDTVQGMLDAKSHLWKSKKYLFVQASHF